MSAAAHEVTVPPRADGDDSTVSETKMRKLAFASIVSTVLEWFDFLVYSTAAALVFGDLFFPTLGGVQGTMASFATLAVGFVARPLGGVIAGHVGDRYGRKVPLVGSMLLMGIATFAVRLLPTYAAIGIWAPILWSPRGSSRGSGWAPSGAGPRCCSSSTRR